MVNERGEEKRKIFLPAFFIILIIRLLFRGGKRTKDVKKGVLGKRKAID